MDDKDKEFQLEIKKQLADKLKEASDAFSDALSIYESLKTDREDNLRSLYYFDNDDNKLSTTEANALETIADSLGSIISSLDSSGWNTSSLGC